MKAEYHQTILDSIDVAIAEHEMIYDNHGNPVDYRYLYVNKPFCDLMHVRAEDVIGKAAYQLFPGVEKTWINRYHKLLETGEAESFTNYTKEVDRYFNVYAVKSGPDRFITSFRDVSSFVRTLNDNARKVDVASNFVNPVRAAYFEFDLKNRTFDYSDVLRDIIGMDIITYDDYVQLFAKQVHPGDQERFETRLRTVFSGAEDELGMEIRFLQQQRQEYVWLSFYAFVEARYRGVPIKLRGLIKDIDTDKRRETEIEAMETLFRETRKVANIATFYYIVDDRAFRPSRELDEFTGIPNLVSIEQFRAIVVAEDLPQYDHSTDAILAHPEGLVTSYRIHKDDTIRYIQSSIFPTPPEDGQIHGVFGILKDVTELEESKREIEYFANHDVLTGLYNRNNYEQCAKELEQQRHLGLMICDVDGLKLINDAFGHMEGDKLLVHLAGILTKVAGVENVYRVGGDEFIITVLDAYDDKLNRMRKQIIDHVADFNVHGVGFGISIGYAIKHDEGPLEQIFRDAENIMYRRKLTERTSRKSSALATIMQTMHERTEETEEHCRRVGEHAAKLLAATGRKRDYELADIHLIADVHDIGKISIRDAILMKPGPLDDDEYEEVKYHAESGYKIIRNIIDNEDIAIAVLYHHERYDGSGYPHGLAGDNIPLYSRIIAICDAYDAMTTRRIYNQPMNHDDAVAELYRNAGTQFDPDLVDKFILILNEE